MSRLSTDLGNYRVDSDVVESAVIAVIHCYLLAFISFKFKMANHRVLLLLLSVVLVILF